MSCQTVGVHIIATPHETPFASVHLAMFSIRTVSFAKRNSSVKMVSKCHRMTAQPALILMNVSRSTTYAAMDDAKIQMAHIIVTVNRAMNSPNTTQPALTLMNVLVKSRHAHIAASICPDPINVDALTAKFLLKTVTLVDFQICATLTMAAAVCIINAL
jgi:electron transfer flavoprotein alpha subunit